jgi:Skp family chaperone for outer membrane proteins
LCACTGSIEHCQALFFSSFFFFSTPALGSSSQYQIIPPGCHILPQVVAVVKFSNHVQRQQELQREENESKLRKFQSDLDRANKDLQECSQHLSESETMRKKLQQELESRDVQLATLQNSKVQVEKDALSKTEMVCRNFFWPSVPSCSLTLRPRCMLRVAQLLMFQAFLADQLSKQIM